MRHALCKVEKQEKGNFPPLLFSEDGSAMIFVLVLAVIGTIMMGSFMMSGRMTMLKSKNRREKVSALNFAEAGKEKAVASMRGGSFTPVAGMSVLFDTTAFGSGYYTVSCSANAAVDTIRLRATGICVTEAVTIEAFYSYAAGSGTGGPAFENGICSGGDITWSGSGSCNCGTAKIHCNGEYGMSGSSTITANILACDGLSRTGSSDIIGDVFAPTVHQTGSGDISGTITIGPVDEITIPDIDLTPYYEHALANGQVYSSNVHYSGTSDYTVPGGIMWVNGTFKRSGSGDFTGCVIATGDVTFSGSGNCNKVEEYPLMVSRDGDIKFSGSGDCVGLFYAKNGKFTKSGSGDVTGAIICKGDFKKSGSWNLLNYVKSIPVPPGGGGNSVTVNLLSWREL